MYDTIIIGSGPAGVTAGIYAVRREMKTLMIGKEAGGQLVLAAEIENYPGFKSIQSFDLIMKLQEQAKSLGVEMKQDEVKQISKNDDGTFTVFTNKEKYQTKTIIIAMGLIPRRLEIPGEVKFNSKGVSYCANCDGPFFRDKNIVVVGGGNSALDAAEVLSKIGKKVYLVHRKDKFRAFEALVSDVEERENIEIILNSNIKEILGDDKVNKVIIEDNNKKTREIEVNGVFIEIGRIAHTDLVAEFVDRDESLQLLVDKSMATKTPGIFAAGDVIASEYKQITIANGQATIAALSAYKYIQEKRK